MPNKNDDNDLNLINQEEELIKRTLMVAAYPALIKTVEKDGDSFYEGFLPGFNDAKVEDLESEDECVEYLQDILDDEVEELVCMGKSLPYVEEDDVLMEKYPNHKIVYLDINVYATREELNYYDACAGECGSCGHKCGEDDFYDDCDCDCDCEDCLEDYNVCDCGHHHHCDCDDCGDDDCDNGNCSCGNDNCNCGDGICSDNEELDNKKNETCSCGEHKKSCDCKEDNHNCCGNHNADHKCAGENNNCKANKANCKSKGNKTCKNNTTKK